MNTARAEFSYSAETYTYMQQSQVAQSVINPGNQIFKLPYLELNLDSRFDLKWEAGPQRAVLRPRLEWSMKESNDESRQDHDTNKSELDITDAFLETQWNDLFSTTIGLQVYQWGPAELLNPSNPIFHFSSNQRSVVFKEKGRALIRLNWYLNQSNSLVFLLEPVSNNEREWIAEDVYKAKAVLKYEKLWTGTADLVGFTAGTQEKSDFFVGEYFNVAFYDGFSVYGDFRHSEKNLHYVPVQNGLLIDFSQADRLKSTWNTLAILGLRYEGDSDIRFEYIYNQAGLTADELSLARQSLQQFLNPNYQQNLERFRRIGLELLSREYIYGSMRVTDPLGWNQVNIYLRRLMTVKGNSSQTQFEFDKGVTDAAALFGGMNVSDGEPQSELRLLNDWSFFCGLKWSL